MSNSTEKTLIEELGPPANPNPSNNPQPPQQRDQAQEWETMARAWLSAFPEGKAVNVSQVEAWIDSNRGSLPSDLQSMPRSDLVDRLLSIQNYMRLPTSQEKETSQIEPPARFQRTDQWLPVYSWLESLDQDEVVKSKEISDWLAANPEIKEQLCSRHSRYHLMHYVKKCHMKILKRREKKHGVQLSGKELALPNNETALTLHTNVVKKQAAPPASNPLNNIPKDSDLYVAKRNEAIRKFEILIELEKKLGPIFSTDQDVNR